MEQQLKQFIGKSYDDDSDVDSNYDDPGSPTVETSPGAINNDHSGFSSNHDDYDTYDAAAICEEFKTYSSILPSPDKLLQEKHSFSSLREKIINTDNVELPRFLKYKWEGGIKPHQALCCLLLNEYDQAKEGKQTTNKTRTLNQSSWSFVRIITFGCLYPQLNNPAEFIRDQFHRVAHAIPMTQVKPHILRSKIKNRGLPVPNYFLDPEDHHQFPPHIALLVILQDGEDNEFYSKYSVKGIVYHVAFALFAFIALLLRIVLEVIGGAGAIWGGGEVFTLRTGDNAELWRWISIAVGTLCFARFVTLQIPQKEDEGDILGPAGPWSLRLPVRLRAVCDHPFHYFVRALPPASSPPHILKKDV